MSPGLRVFSPGRLPCGLFLLISALVDESNFAPALGALTPAPVVELALAVGGLVPASVPPLCAALGEAADALEFMSTLACAKAAVLASAKAPAIKTVLSFFITGLLIVAVWMPQRCRIGTCAQSRCVPASTTDGAIRS